MKILYIGGTGEISLSCVERSVAQGHETYIFNRGKTSENLPTEVKIISGDLNNDADYSALAEHNFDAVCQFIVYTRELLERDISIFSGKCGQYVFISSATVYEKPFSGTIITENVQRCNPFSEYAKNKLLCEQRLEQANAHGDFPYTIVRPSHTFRKRFPGGICNGDDWAWRVLNDKPVIIQGDGTTLWTYTHSDDFAIPFVNLLGNKRAYGEDFHITRHLKAFTWNAIFEEIGKALHHETKICHVPTATLNRFNPDWDAGLTGDKSWSLVFDNSKAMDVAGAFECKVSLEDGIRSIAEDFLKNRMENHKPDSEAHALIDKIIDAQNAVGS